MDLNFFQKLLKHNLLVKGGYPIGTIRLMDGHNYKKVADTGGKGDWIKITPGMGQEHTEKQRELFESKDKYVEGLEFLINNSYRSKEPATYFMRELYILADSMEKNGEPILAKKLIDIVQKSKSLPKKYDVTTFYKNHLNDFIEKNLLEKKEENPESIFENIIPQEGGEEVLYSHYTPEQHVKAAKFHNEEILKNFTLSRQAANKLDWGTVNELEKKIKHHSQMKHFHLNNSFGK